MPFLAVALKNAVAPRTAQVHAGIRVAGSSISPPGHSNVRVPEGCAARAALAAGPLAAEPERLEPMPGDLVVLGSRDFRILEGRACIVREVVARPAPYISAVLRALGLGAEAQ